MDIEGRDGTSSLSGDTAPLIESQPLRSNNPSQEDSRRELIEHLTKWKPVSSRKIDPSSIDYSVFPKFWEGAGGAGVKRHRKEFRKRLFDAVEHDDAVTLGKLLQLPMRLRCYGINYVDVDDDLESFGPENIFESRDMTTFAPGELLENNLEGRHPGDPQDFRPTPYQSRRTDADKVSQLSIESLGVIAYIWIYTVFAIFFGYIFTFYSLVGIIHLPKSAVVIWGAAPTLGLLGIITIAVIFSVCCFMKDDCWCGCVGIGPWYRHFGFDCAHRVHNLILRVCGPRCVWCCCCQAYHTKSADLVAEGFGRCGPESCEKLCCCCNWDPQVISCCGVLSHLCGSLVTEEEQFMLLQFLLEDEGDDGRSVLKAAARRGNAAVLELLRPHGVDHLVHYYARARWNVAHVALAEAVTIAARYADAVYRGLHVAVLEELESIARPISHNAPSQYLPPARPCIRGAHVPSAQPQCQNCQSRLQYETQDQYAPLLTRYHLNGQAAKIIWSNSNAQRWAAPGCHVEMAKLYCSQLGQHADAIAKTDFVHLDATALFNMLAWCNGVSEAMRGPAGAARAGAKARNDLKHTDVVGVSPDVYDSIFDGLRTFLECVAADQSTTDDIAASARASLDRISELHDSGSHGAREPPPLLPQSQSQYEPISTLSGMNDPPEPLKTMRHAQQAPPPLSPSTAPAPIYE